MAEADEPANMEQLLARVEQVSPGARYVSVGRMMDAVGRRSFGPVLLLVGLILITPLSGLPGMPTLSGLLVLITLSQLLLGHEHIWLPDWILRREVPRARLMRGLTLLHPLARLLDGISQPRLTVLVKGLGLDVMAVVCVFLGFVMPVTEIIPFSASLVGVALMAFGLAMIARDGLIALFAWTLTLTTPVLILVNLV
ncbi:MAG: exopolysaccharide biosynthesis protein [Marinobacter sp.]|uniref:exopolysaccharide biosynthesis protein n=1 Tax=Marinobacter sp. TaxID=50741 RepID=UPI00299E7248|nr:exopolysaccharide biosynthesis protein [Marinobacter sp.]MDX1635937.1 exopolysaccharide biosynthesis protein [Marinobacter sp.]